ncbi:MAG: tetratricopeptide repeat protein, partial [Candidatus Saccharicenans sp.]
MHSNPLRTAFGLILFSLILIAFWSASPLLLGQENLGRGRITGTVSDEADNPIEGAKITVQSLATKTVLEGVSDKKGHFAVAGLGTGIWRVKASKEGYLPSQIDYDVKQLTRNPPIIFKLKKASGVTALAADEGMLKLFEQGNNLLNEGQVDEALKIFEDFITKYPDIYPARLNIGLCYLKKEDYDRAETEFNFVLNKIRELSGDLKKDPTSSVRALSGLGEIYIKKGDFDKALGYFKQAVEISPEDEATAYNVGNILFSHQQVDEAITYFELATKIKPTWPNPYVKLGYAYVNKGEYKKAIENFNKFIELDPQNPEVPQVKNIIAAIE